MNQEVVWVVIVGGMIVTYSLRSSFLVLLGKESIPLWLFKSLRYTPAVVLSALITQMVVKNADAVQISFDNPKILAALIALFVAWKTRNSIITLVAGMGALWLLTIFLK